MIGRRLARLVCVCLLAVVGASAEDARRVVYLLTAGAEGSPTPELVQAELRAAGFDVLVQRRREAISVRALSNVTAERGNAAALTTRQSAGGLEATVWLTDRASGQGTEHHVTVGSRGDEGARLLALRVTEVLHANSLELAIEPDVAPTDPALGEAPPATREEAASSRRPRERPSPWAVAAGPALFAGPGGIPVGVAPLGLVSLGFTRRWAVELVVSGPAVGTVEATGGEASVDQEVLAVRARLAARTGAIDPYVNFGGGGYRLGAQGDARPPLTGASASQVSLLGLVGLGARWSLSERLGIVTELSGAFVLPRPVLYFDSSAEASAGAPLLIGVVALELGF